MRELLRAARPLAELPKCSANRLSCSISSYCVLENPTRACTNGQDRTEFVHQDYGVLETITKVESADNACSKAKTTSTVRRKPGASPLLFGEFLMQLCAFVFLEDISGELPPYEETYLSVPMDASMQEAYRELEDDMRKALKAHRGNRSVLSTMLNTLLLYPDHPYGIGTLYGTEFDPELKRRVRFVITEPATFRRTISIPRNGG